MGCTKICCMCGSAWPISNRVMELLRPLSQTSAMPGSAREPARTGTTDTLSDALPLAGTCCVGKGREKKAVSSRPLWNV